MTRSHALDTLEYGYASTCALQHSVHVVSFRRLWFCAACKKRHFCDHLLCPFAYPALPPPPYDVMMCDVMRAHRLVRAHALNHRLPCPSPPPPMAWCRRIAEGVRRRKEELGRWETMDCGKVRAGGPSMCVCGGGGAFGQGGFPFLPFKAAGWRRCGTWMTWLAHTRVRISTPFLPFFFCPLKPLDG